jgi:hypothetical protein
VQIDHGMGRDGQIELPLSGSLDKSETSPRILILDGRARYVANFMRVSVSQDSAHE